VNRWVRTSVARRMKSWPAWPGQQPKRRECFQVQSPRYRKSGPRLVGAQGKFHCRSIDGINLVTIKPASGQCYLGREYYIALHSRGRGLKWGARKHSSVRSARRHRIGWIDLLVFRRASERLSRWRGSNACPVVGRLFVGLQRRSRAEGRRLRCWSR
jgi:hypothetical protein